MDSLMSGKRGNPGFGKIMWVAVLIAVLAVAAIVAGIFMIPTEEHKKQEILQGALKEGDPAFDEYTKNIIITNDPNRMQQAQTGLGDVVMQLSGRIRNNGDKTLTGLEVSVGMVDTKNQLIKDKKVMFVPKHYPELKPKETIDVSVSIAGFSNDDDRANARWKVTAIKLAEKKSNE